jgi:lipid A 3-O-deacylase
MLAPSRPANLLLFSSTVALCAALLGPCCVPAYAADSTQPPATTVQATPAPVDKNAVSPAFDDTGGSANAGTAAGASAGTATGANAGSAAGTGTAKTPVKDPPLPTQYGASVEYDYAYDPSPNPSFMLARVFAIFDYGSVWHQDCPNTLRFKVEAAAGSTLNPGNDLIVSVNMLALKYPFKLGPGLRPFVEGGIGLIYTQFKVPGQGLHFNFNPLLGVGCDMPQADGKNFFATIRLHHLSNAELNHNNRGVNSLGLQIGRFF